MAPGDEFVIRLHNSRKSLSAVGIRADHSDGRTLRIDWIRPDGMFGSWNASNPNKQVQVGDWILSVNGRRDDALAILSALGKEEHLDVAVRKAKGSLQSDPPKRSPKDADCHPPVARPVSGEAVGLPEVPVRLCNQSRSLDGLGISMNPSMDAGLLISRIVPSGVLGAWNKQHPAEEVRAGDTITAVNGVTGNFGELVRELERCAELELSLCRGSASVPPVPEASQTRAGGLSRTAAASQRALAPGQPAADRPPASTGRAPGRSCIGLEEEGEEGDEDGGPRWFRVAYRPHVPARFLVCRPRGSSASCKLRQSELLEVQEVRGGWACLAPEEISRRCQPETIQLWVLIDGTALGFARFLALAPAPMHYTREGGGVLVSENLGQWSDVHSPWDPGQIVQENDRAWELLQERLRNNI